MTFFKGDIVTDVKLWTMSSRDETNLRIFERRILRKIFGPVQDGEGRWRIRMKHELDQLIEGTDVVGYIKAQRVAWVGHLGRMNEQRGVKRIVQWTPEGQRARGRPRKRWMNDVLEDIRTMKIKKWKWGASDRTGWANIVEQAKFHCSAEGIRRRDDIVHSYTLRRGRTHWQKSLPFIEFLKMH